MEGQHEPMTMGNNEMQRLTEIVIQNLREIADKLESGEYTVAGIEWNTPVGYVADGAKYTERRYCHTGHDGLKVQWIDKGKETGYFRKMVP